VNTKERFELVDEPRPRMRDWLTLDSPPARTLLVLPWAVALAVLGATVIRGVDLSWTTFILIGLAGYVVEAVVIRLAPELNRQAGAAEATAITVGPEGIVVHNRNTAPELIPLDRITSVRATQERLHIRVRREGSMSFALANMQAARRAAQLFEAFRGVGRKGEAAEKVAERAGASHAAMAEQLAAATNGHGSYRDESLTSDDLADLVGSAGTAPRFRIAAAAALKRIDVDRAARATDLVVQGTVNEPLQAALSDLMNDQLAEAQIAAAERWHGEMHDTV
jgi:hypothetical protein